jgi:hypothetical protein
MNSSVIASFVLVGTTTTGGAGVVGVSGVAGVSTEDSGDFDGVDESEEEPFLQAETSNKKQSNNLMRSSLMNEDCQGNLQKMWNL